MNILESIRKHKAGEVSDRKMLYPVKLLERSLYFGGPSVSLKEYVTDTSRSGIIAEFKRRSPSKGDINRYADAGNTTLGYMQAGASALSVLTDEHFFGARSDDITDARRFNYCPILRKDFIIDEYQVVESKSIGADAMLLIASLLLPKEIKKLSVLANSLGMEVLLEVHNEEEIYANIESRPHLIGVNNRDLNTFDVDVERSLQLLSYIPKDTPAVAESGIDSASVIRKLKGEGFKGFLIGEYFMKHSNPAGRCKELIKELQL